MGIKFAGSIPPLTAFAIPTVTWLLIIGFGCWVFCNIKIRSGPYLLVYWLLQFPLLYVANMAVEREFRYAGTTLQLSLLSRFSFFSQPGFLAQMTNIGSLAASTSTLLIALLVLSELCHILLDYGVVIRNIAVRVLIPLRNYSIFIGLIAIALAAIAQFSWLVLYI
jgi:hypothetical protein